MTNRNAYLIRLIHGSTIYPTEHIKATNFMFGTLLHQIRGIATNINQLAKIANSTGALSEAEKLNAALESIKEIRAQMGPLWNKVREVLYGDPKDSQ